MAGRAPLVSVVSLLASIAGILWLRIGAAPNAAAQAQGRPPAPAAVDRAFELVGPPWHCVTFEGTEHDELFEGNVRSEFFEQGDPDEITSTTSFFDVSGAGRTTVRLHRDRSGRWLLFENGLLVASATPWTQPQWIFERQPKATSQHLPIRGVLTDLGTLAFRRDIQARDNGAWHTVAGETCKRASQ